MRSAFTWFLESSGVKFRSLLKKGFQFGKRNNAGEWTEILAQILIPVYITTWFRGSLSLWQLSIYEVAGKKTKASYINFLEYFALMVKDAFS